MRREALNHDIRISKRSKRLSITVNTDGKVIVTVPYRLAHPRGIGKILAPSVELLVGRFLYQKREWIAKSQESMRKAGEKLRERPFLAKGTRKEFLLKKEDARMLAHGRSIYFQKILNDLHAPFTFSFKKIAIKNQKSRWGSCSRTGNLNFNYKIVLLPPECADYLVVHELCHLKEFNHSQRFWKLIESVLPDYRRAKAMMRY